MEKIVDETYQRTRIYVFIGGQYPFMAFMHCLEERELLDSGEYMIILINDEFTFSNNDMNILPDQYVHRVFSRSKKKVLKATSYQSVLQITLTTPSSKLMHFYKEIREKAKEKFNVPYHSRILPLFLSAKAAYLFDAIMIYANAATKVLESKEDLRDGKSLMQKYVFNKTFTSIQGFDIFIDENGNAEGNFSLFTIQVVNKTYSIQQVGTFIECCSRSGLPELKLNQERQILWVNGFPPVDEPECGFEGCSYNWSMLIIISSIISSLFLLSYLILRHYRYEQNLQSILWKVDLKDINQFSLEEEKYVYNKTINSNHHHSTRVDRGRNSIFKIGKYRGNLVIMKKVNKRMIELTRNVRKELKLMRELRHENLVTFIGVTLEHSNIYIVSSYCARGSLENLLMNIELKLDEMFISSLIFDLIKGMIFLHDSEIGWHGNLRTSNCLVDARWCLKIADFGLNEFKSGAINVDRTEEKEIKQNLTIAPELLQTNLICRTQKGDIYSFGIILYETYGRRGPFGIGYKIDCNTIHTYREIILNLKDPTKHIRPSLNNFNAPDCVRETIQMCWQNQPSERPTMRMIQLKLKELKWGLKSNIFDNIMSLMEKYAFNLEELVQERTNQLLEEKKKTENLLLRMLPKSVAETLIRNQKVNAEYYECITIMFSDLVGFTQICSSSSPLEVVDMLNDLYSLMDSVIANFDCYKVETIGDAYMVCSGVPIRNEDHASQIASLALAILKTVSTLEIRHRPGELFKIRIGIHSGQVVAGVVGNCMPRYCLFGDTVNLASRLESTSLPLKAQISFATYDLLLKCGNFICVEREGGTTFIKGKGQIKTYWLNGKL